MIDEWWIEKIWKETFLASSRFYPGICLEILRKSMENLSQFTTRKIVQNPISGTRGNTKHKEVKLTLSLTVAPRSKVGAVFTHWNTGVVGLNLTQGMDLCYCFVFLLSCICSSLPKESYRLSISLRNCRHRPRFIMDCSAHREVCQCGRGSCRAVPTPAADCPIRATAVIVTLQRSSRMKLMYPLIVTCLINLSELITFA